MDLKFKVNVFNEFPNLVYQIIDLYFLCIFYVRAVEYLAVPNLEYHSQLSLTKTHVLRSTIEMKALGEISTCMLNF